jgi:hypothetical protein
MLQLLSYMVFFGKNPVFFTSSEKALLDHTDPISTLKLTLFSQGNNVVVIFVRKTQGYLLK